jgi:hypothetical protein
MSPNELSLDGNIQVVFVLAPVDVACRSYHAAAASMKGHVVPGITAVAQTSEGQSML